MSSIAALISRIAALVMLFSLILAVSSKPMKTLKQFDPRGAMEDWGAHTKPPKPSHIPSPSKSFGPSITRKPHTKTEFGSLTCLTPSATTTYGSNGGGGDGGWGAHGN